MFWIRDCKEMISAVSAAKLRHELNFLLRTGVRTNIVLGLNTGTTERKKRDPSSSEIFFIFECCGARSFSLE